MSYHIRKYSPERDFEAVKRTWQEIHWIEPDQPDDFLAAFVKGGRSLVAESGNNAECLVTSKPSHLRYLGEDLNLSVVTSVTTSHVARKQGLAQSLTARLIAEDAAAGAIVSTLGIFEQGFYNKLGYGNGSYEHWITFDPADILVDEDLRPPQRLTSKDWSAIHQALLNRKKRHGACTILTDTYMEAELGWSKGGFGLGYRDGVADELTHYFWATNKGEHGPLTIHSMAFQNSKQFLELMGVIKSLGDQIRLVKMREPAGLQMQDIIRTPFRLRIATEKSGFEHINRATSYWQTRICNLEACLAATHLNSRSIQFNLDLTDPIETLLDSDSPWKGCAGQFTIHLGPESSSQPGFETGLPTLKADIGAFTRLWLGVQPATGLSITDGLSGPDELLNDLDDVLCLPSPHPDWDY